MGTLVLGFILVWGKWCRAIIPHTNLATTYPAENPLLVPHGQPPNLADRGFGDSPTLVSLLPPQTLHFINVTHWALSAHDVASCLCSCSSLCQAGPSPNSSLNSCTYSNTLVLAACVQKSVL